MSEFNDACLLGLVLSWKTQVRIPNTHQSTKRIDLVNGSRERKVKNTQNINRSFPLYKIHLFYDCFQTFNPWDHLSSLVCLFIRAYFICWLALLWYNIIYLITIISHLFVREERLFPSNYTFSILRVLKIIVCFENLATKLLRCRKCFTNQHLDLTLVLFGSLVEN